ncbi:MAG: phosphate ABC transporter substrate-binding protein PstS [Bdellovibrionales bacterium]
MSKQPRLGFVTLILSVICTCSAWGAPILVNGAGSTFAAPLYAKWAAEYRQLDPSIEINYQSIGSGGGVRQFIAGTVDFGATDDPMNDDEVKQVKGAMFHLPTAIGGVVITFNIPGLEVTEAKPLRLTAEVVAEIFMGKITKWDDAKIKTLNPALKLPAQFIVVASRADGSGTTAVFTQYLSDNSAEWKAKVGNGKAIKFPTGLGGKGNEGVTGLVRQNPGAIGYVELTYAKVNKLPMAAIKNAAGEFVAPSLESLTAAAANMKSVPADLRLSMRNTTGKTSYPIAAFTYLLVNQNMSANKSGKFVEFLNWALDKGQTVAPTLNYAPLPEAVLRRAKQVVAGMSAK